MLNASAPLSARNGTPGHHKTVPMPRSLPELQQAAALHFKTDGRMRLYHHDQDSKELHHPASVGGIKDGDTVLVRIEKSRALGACTLPGRSTHQSDFVEHNSDPAVPTMNDATSTLTADIQGLPLEGQSCYALDYVRYPATPRRGPLGKSALYGQHFLKHAGEERPMSSYKQQFRWPDAKAAESAGSDDASVLTAASKGHRFTATTRYAEDFDAKRWQVPPPPKPAGNDSSSTLTDAVARVPFEGQSSYSDHFIKHAQTGRQRNCRPENGTAREQSFAGSSEYRHKYADDAVRQPIVHLKRIE